MFILIFKRILVERPSCRPDRDIEKVFQVRDEIYSWLLTCLLTLVYCEKSL